MKKVSIKFAILKKKNHLCFTNTEIRRQIKVSAPHSLINSLKTKTGAVAVVHTCRVQPFVCCVVNAKNMTIQKLEEANELDLKNRNMRTVHEKIVSGIESSIKAVQSFDVTKEMDLKKLQEKLINVCAEHIMPIRKTVRDKFEKL